MKTPSLYELKFLFGQLAAGDEMAFRQIFDLYKFRVQSVALRILKDPADAEEIVQEVFLKLWVNQASGDKIEDPEAWLFTVVYNTIYNWTRKAANNTKLLDRLIHHIKAEQILQGEDVIIAEETRQIINKAIEKLPEQRKLIFQLSRQEGLSYQEIAEQLNISKHTVRNQLTQALQSIRTSLVQATLTLVIVVWNGL